MPAATSNETNILMATGTFDTSVALTDVHLADGRVLRLPTAVLSPKIDGLLPAPDASAGVIPSPDAGAHSTGDSMVIPIVEEHLEVGKRTVTTGKVRLQKTVHEFEAALDEPLAVRTYDIERIVLNQQVDAPPAVRYEGDTTIYPLVEERLILTKQLVLKEEVRVTKRDTERRDTQVVTLRREHLVVEREPVD